MKKLKTHSKNSLFLLEMILSLLFLALACSACVQVFAAAYTNRLRARQLNHIQELTTTVGEILEGWDPNSKTLSQLLDEEDIHSHQLTRYYDSDWNVCEKDEAQFVMTLDFQITSTQKEGKLTFSLVSGESLYKQDIRYPFWGKGGSAHE